MREYILEIIATNPKFKLESEAEAADFIEKLMKANSDLEDAEPVVFALHRLELGVKEKEMP